jgi:hypothetical protein
MREEGDEDELLPDIFKQRGKWAGLGHGLGHASGLLLGCGGGLR